MALINCEECGREISDRATVCPHCGSPVPPAEAAVVPTPARVDTAPPKPPSRFRLGLKGKIALAVAGALVLGGAAWGIVAAVTGGDRISAASNCDDLVRHYEGLVASLVGAEGDTDPALYGVMAYDLGRWLPGYRVTAWLGDMTESQALAILQDVEGWPEVWEGAYFTKADALEEFRWLFADQPALIQTVENDPSVLPASLRFQVSEDAIDVVTNRVAVYPGVQQVSSATQEVVDLQASVASVAIDRAGLRNTASAIGIRAEQLGCPVSDIARASDLTGVEPQGPIGELIMTVARDGLPLLP